MSWAVGMRVNAARQETFRDALTSGEVLRTHAFRGTWHLIAKDDVRWVLSLVGERVVRKNARRYAQLALDDETLHCSAGILGDALARSAHHLTRPELAESLVREGIDASGQRLAYLVQFAELTATIVSGVPRDGEHTYAPFDQRVPDTSVLPVGEAMRRLVIRYYETRGPATVADLIWWCGLPSREVKAALADAGDVLSERTVQGQTLISARNVEVPSEDPEVRLLPAFDEFLVSYKERELVLAPEMASRVNAGGGLLAPTVIVGGQVVGTWKANRTVKATRLEVRPFRPLSRDDRGALEKAAEGYRTFSGVPVVVSFATTVPTSS